jgi:hypothetical protein
LRSARLSCSSESPPGPRWRSSGRTGAAPALCSKQARTQTRMRFFAKKGSARSRPRLWLPSKSASGTRGFRQERRSRYRATAGPSRQPAIASGSRDSLGAASSMTSYDETGHRLLKSRRERHLTGTADSWWRALWAR